MKAGLHSPSGCGGPYFGRVCPWAVRMVQEMPVLQPSHCVLSQQALQDPMSIPCDPSWYTSLAISGWGGWGGLLEAGGYPQLLVATG